MKRIELLDKKVYDKIAAGEIIESPVSVVKELLENSLDARSSIIEIDIENAGMSLIRILDNGNGIHSEDLEKAFLSHATSKISTEDDLEKIESFGFRGEALASIASVSETILTSRTKDASFANYLLLSEGIISSSGRTKMGIGTKIEVKNLFFNLPARKKFIKNLNTEAAKITELLSRYALGHPEKDFILKRDREIVLDTRGYQGLTKRIENIMFLNVKDFYYAEKKEEGMAITAALFDPSISKNNRQHQIFFINGRLIKSVLLQNMLDEVYDTFMNHSRFPTAIINLVLDPLLLDVNIHPAKTEIRILNEGLIREKMTRFLRESLLDGMTKKNNMSAIATMKPAKEAQIDIRESKVQEKERSYKVQGFDFTYPQNKTGSSLTPKSTHVFSNLQIIGQFKKTFILAEDLTDLYIIDQHVLHERILYEKYIEMINQSKVKKETLLHPETLTLSPAEEGILIKHIVTLNNFGFEIESFGYRSYLLRTLPLGFEMHNIPQFFSDLLNDLEVHHSQTSAKINESVIVNASCKAAVKASRQLSHEKISYLLQELDKTENPFTCPHGRPIIKKISVHELYKFFQRGTYYE